MVDLRQAVTQGLAPDNGLYMPQHIPELPKEFFQTIHEKSFRDIALAVSHNIIGEDIPYDELKRIVDHTIQFEAPVVPLRRTSFA
jgi:threonine synthase